MYCLSDLSAVPIVFFINNFGVFYGDLVSSSLDVVLNCRDGALSGGVFLEPCPHISASFSNIVIITILAFYMINYATLIFYFCLVLRVN